MRACAIYDITPHVGPPTISGFPTPSVMAFDKAFKASLLSTVLPGTVHKPDLSAMVRAMHHQLLWDIRSRRDNRCKVNERTAEKQTRSEHGATPFVTMFRIGTAGRAQATSAAMQTDVA